MDPSLVGLGRSGIIGDSTWCENFENQTYKKMCRN